MATEFSSRLHIPKAPFRPDEDPDFSYLDIPSPESSSKPECLIDPNAIRHMAYGLVRVLDDDHKAKGEWHPQLKPDVLRQGLKKMMHVRAFDERMFTMQRQGKLSFYIKSTGEEAVSIAQAMALDPEDMFFPTYRQQGLLFARDCPVVNLMCQCLSNSHDSLKGRQLPTLYSWKEGGFFTISGNLATQYCQAVGWAMAAAYKGEKHIAAAWVGDGSTAEADVYHALQFSSTYQAPVILNVVNNQWPFPPRNPLPPPARPLLPAAWGFIFPAFASMAMIF